MDRAALVERNRKLAAAHHRTSLKQRLRRALLYDLGRLPIPSRKPPERERFLLIRPDHLGDVLLTTPAISALRAKHPNAEFHALVGPWSGDVLARYDEIDVVLTLPFPGFSRTPKSNWRSPYQVLLESAQRLRKIGYSAAIIFRPDHWWGAMLAKFAGIPVRIGYDLPDGAPFLTDKIEPLQAHAVAQNLRLVERWTGHIDPATTALRFPVDSFDRAYVDSYLETWGVSPDTRIFALHPGAGTWVKRWDDDRWPMVVDTLSEQLEARLILTGGDPELPLVKKIAAKMQQPAVLMAGDTNVGQLAALFSRAQVVLGPDSGPLHLAVAVATPTVALFGPADPGEFGPWGSREKHIVLASPIGCRPCRVLDWGGDDPANHPCLRDITQGQVLEAARRVVQAAVR